MGPNSIINLGSPPLEKDCSLTEARCGCQSRTVHRAHLLLPKPAVLSNEQAVSDAPLSRGAEGPRSIYSAFAYSHTALITLPSAQTVLLRAHTG